MTLLFRAFADSVPCWIRLLERSWSACSLCDWNLCPGHLETVLCLPRWLCLCQQQRRTGAMHCRPLLARQRHRLHSGMFQQLRCGIGFYYTFMSSSSNAVCLTTEHSWFHFVLCFRSVLLVQRVPRPPRRLSPRAAMAPIPSATKRFALVAQPVTPAQTSTAPW
jgi:hypothetical protein